MKLDRGFRFPCVTVKKIKIEVKSTSSPDQKVKAQNSFIHAGFQNHKGSNPTSEMSKISFSCGLDRLSLDAIRVPSSAFSFAFSLASTAGIFFQFLFAGRARSQTRSGSFFV